MITTLIEREAEPVLISDLTWREFKAVEQLIERPGLRLSFLMECWRFGKCQEKNTKLSKNVLVLY